MQLEMSALNNRLQQIEKMMVLQNDRINSLEKSNNDLKRIVLEKSERVEYLESVVKKLAQDTPPGTNEDVDIVVKESSASGSGEENGPDRVIRDSTGNKDKRQNINPQGTIMSLNVELLGNVSCKIVAFGKKCRQNAESKNLKRVKSCVFRAYTNVRVLLHLFPHFLTQSAQQKGIKRFSRHLSTNLISFLTSEIF
jgi:hypothetical protein